MKKLGRPYLARPSLLGFLVPLLGLLSLLLWNQAHAATPTESAGKNTKSEKKSTEVNFEDVLVQGKYHFSDEAVTTVEEDKVLDSLLGVRKDFQDRIKKSVSRQ